jgi:perosamine synthetase
LIASMSAPDLTDAEIKAVMRVLSTPTLSIGPEIRNFEQSLADYVGVQYAIGVNSGTSGLHLSILAADVQENDFVVTTPFSFIASANCILYERAIPVFVDVDPSTACINANMVIECVKDIASDPAKARLWLPKTFSETAKTQGRLKAILPVHAFGQPAEMDPIMAIAEALDLYVIEDACESLGAEYKGRKTGAIGDVAVFAFYPNKQMTTGEGGMIVTNRDNWNNLFRSLRNQGRDHFNGWLDHTRLGYNYRMDEMSAALGVVQANRIEELLAKRERVARWYSERLIEQELIQVPYIHSSTTRMSWFVYVVQILAPAKRDAVIAALEERGVPSRPYFTPIHLQPFYVQKFGYQEGDFPVTEHLGKISLALPFSSVMSEAQVDFVCKELISVTEGFHI